MIARAKFIARMKSSAPMKSARRRAQLGVTLIEATLVIAIGGIVLAGIAGAIAWATARSGSNWPIRQSLSVAESLLAEIGLKPNTRCDADGPAAARGGVCGIANGIGPEAGEDRFSYAQPFDHSDDYHGFAMAAPPGVRKLDGTVVAGLESYSAQVSVQAQALDGVAATEGSLATVMVVGPAGTSIRLQLWRARTDR